MRILIAHSFYRIAGGEDRYVVQQRELLAPGHDVELLAVRNEDLPGPLRTAGRMIGRGLRPGEVDRVFERHRPDVVHLHNAYPALGPAVHLAARRHRVPLVMTVHNYRLRCPNGLMFTEGRPCTRCLGGNTAHAVVHHCFPSRTQAAGYATALWLHRFVLRLERDVALFLAPSEFVAATLTGWGVPRERVRVVRNFTDVGPGASGAEPRYGLYLGRLTPEKGVDVLLRAAAAAGDPELRVAGEGPDEPRLRAEAARLGLTRTAFLGKVRRDEVPALLSGARYLALPSIWEENAPLAALEAMAAGCPLLVSDKGGLPELAAGGAGIVCPAGDVTSFAAGIERLSAGAERDALARAAQSFAEQHLTRDVHRASLERAYEEVSSSGLERREEP